MDLQKASELDEPLEADDEGDDEPSQPELARDEELSTRKRIREQCSDIYDTIDRGYQDQYERINRQMDYWDIYNCALGPKQFYSGNSRIFVPIVHDAVNARKTRFTNQIFPVSGRYVEATSEDGTIPHARVALLEHYIRKGRLRTEVMPAMMRNGDVEGQYTVYVSWTKQTRHVTYKVKRPVEAEGIEIPDEDVDDIAEETLTTGFPAVEVISDTDLIVLPATADSVEEALSVGGAVTVVRRWSKAQIRRKIAEGEITKDAGAALILSVTEDVGRAPKVDKGKEMADAAGIRRGRGNVALVFETWCTLKVGKERRICRVYFGGGAEENLLGVKRNPNWSDKLPLLSVPVEKIQGSFKGQSKVAPVADLQYFANDTLNEGADSAAYALMPIIMTDPEKNPRIGSMILSLAAIWQTSPNDTKFAEFPELWKQALELVASTKQEIFQCLSVNPAAITQQGMGSRTRLNAAQIASEQQVDVLTTADTVTVVEEGILTPMLNRMLELDHQHRDKAITVKQFGEMGTRSEMTDVPPTQFDARYSFRWFGVEAARSAQQMQQQIAMTNVLRGIPPEQMNGYKLNLVPVITQLVENTFGPRLAPLVFESPEMQLPVPVNEENLLLAEGFTIPVHEMDDDDQHIQQHMMVLQQLGGKNSKKFQTHIFAHMQQKAKKQQATMAMQQGEPGIPGGAGPGGPQPAPGVAGTPRIGAQPGMPRTQGPPGSIHADRMQDPSMMPRRQA